MTGIVIPPVPVRPITREELESADFDLSHSIDMVGDFLRHDHLKGVFFELFEGPWSTIAATNHRDAFWIFEDQQPYPVVPLLSPRDAGGASIVGNDDVTGTMVDSWVRALRAHFTPSRHPHLGHMAALLIRRFSFIALFRLTTTSEPFGIMALDPVLGGHDAMAELDAIEAAFPGHFAFTGKAPS